MADAGRSTACNFGDDSDQCRYMQKKQKKNLCFVHLQWLLKKALNATREVNTKNIVYLKGLLLSIQTKAGEL